MNRHKSLGIRLKILSIAATSTLSFPWSLGFPNSITQAGSSNVQPIREQVTYAQLAAASGWCSFLKENSAFNPQPSGRKKIETSFGSPLELLGDGSGSLGFAFCSTQSEKRFEPGCAKGMSKPKPGL